MPVRLVVSAAATKAIEAVERAGGSITTMYHDRIALRLLLKPHKFELKPRPAYPPPRLMARYMDPEKRGYLAEWAKEQAAATPEAEGQPLTKAE